MARNEQGKETEVQALPVMEIIHLETYHPCKLFNGVTTSFDVKMGYQMSFDREWQFARVRKNDGEIIIPAGNIAWMQARG